MTIHYLLYEGVILGAIMYFESRYNKISGILTCNHTSNYISQKYDKSVLNSSCRSELEIEKKKIQSNQDALI